MLTKLNGQKCYFDITSSGLIPVGIEMQVQPTLIALHGSYLDHSYLKPFLNQFGTKFQIIYLDYRGSGRSTRNDPDSWNIEQLAKDVLALADKLDIQTFHLFAHSWGCHVAAQINYLAPSRVCSNMLCNPAFFHLSEYLDFVLNNAGVQAVQYATEIFQDRDSTNFTEYMTHVGPLLFCLDPEPEIFARAIPSIEFFLHSMEELHNIDLKYLLSEIVSPTIVFMGTLDPYASNKSAEACDHLVNKPNIQMVYCKNSSHFVFLDEADIVIKHLERFSKSNIIIEK